VLGPLSLDREEEARLGREQHPKVLAQFGGAYEDPKVQAYVESVGNRVKEVTELKDEEFTFTVLDSDVVNAFALPGGYVYVSRGLLALARDEAELAGVLGHEIGHVVARHTAQRYDRTRVGQLGAVAAQLGGMLLGGYLGGQGGAQAGAQLGGQLGAAGATYYVQGFSREQEFEADELGVEYLRGAGYEPRAMASFLQQLSAEDGLKAARTGKRDAAPSWLRSHPRTADRVTRAAELVAEESPAARDQNRERFLAAIDGLVYGDSPAQGFVRGRAFEHPELGFRFEAPEGFTLRNTPAAVIGQDRAGRFMQFGMAQGRAGDAEAYITQEWVKQGRVRDLQGTTVGGLDAAIAFADVQVNNKPAQAMLAAIDAGNGSFYRFVYGDPAGLSRSDAAEFEASLESFRRLRAGESAFRPVKVDIYTTRSGDTQESVARRMEVETLPLETFRVLNGLSLASRCGRESR
jgi:predicted Zn-dependent protease